MTTHLDDPDLDIRLLAADPFDVRAVRAAAASPAATELGRAITGTKQASGWSRRRRLTVVAAAAAAIVAALPLGFTFVHPSGDSAYSAPLVRFAEHSPRLLVGAAGWRVTRADEPTEDTGEMTFTSAPRSLDVFWVPGAHEKDSDKLDMTHLSYARIDGARAWVGTYGDHEYEAIWSVGNQAREARGSFPTERAFLAVARTLHRVGVDAWLDAMPASVVDPGARAATVDRMLADIPQPDGFDERSLVQATGVQDRYQLGAQVSGAVSCAWIDQYTHGDAAQRAQASAAMATSRRWAILREMTAQGDYPEVLWQVADAMNGKHVPRPAGESLQQWAGPALGC